MKKNASIALSLSLMLALAACGGNTDTTSGPAGGAAPDSASQPAGSGSNFNASTDVTVITRENGSGTRGAFIELFGIEEKDADGNKRDNTSIEAIEVNSTSVVMTTVAGDVHAIGYISLGSLNDTVTALSINGVAATVENIKNGTYVVSRPFNVATNGDLSAAAQDFMDFVLSAEGQQVVEASGYIASVDDAAAYTGSAPGDKVVIAGSSSVTPVMEKLVEAYRALNPDAQIEIQESDSSVGMQSTIDGICDIGMASRELKESELEAGLVPTVIAIDGIAVVVNNDNPVESLTTEQVREIFTADFISWEDFV